MNVTYALLFFLTFVPVGSTLLAQGAHGKAKLHGKIINGGASIILEEFSDLQYMVPKSDNPVIEINRDSSFRVEIELSQPNYFRLGRNKLYLSPGDNMEVFIDVRDCTKSWFKGKGDVANNFLRNAPFPKGGSYLEAGRELRRTPEAALEYIMQEGKRRINLVNQLKGVPESFKRLELVRVRADMVNSMKGAEGYAFSTRGVDQREEATTFIIAFRKLYKPTMDSLLKGFVHKDYLMIEVYRDIANMIDTSAIKDPATRKVYRDFAKAKRLAFDYIKPENDKKRLPLYEDSIKAITTVRYNKILRHLMAEKMKYGNGDPAVDFTAFNPDGSVVKLSSLKGKVIYVDMWATWCGPCMGEMPFLEKLKQKYAGNESVAIVSLSIDDNTKLWLESLDERKADGIQWRIDRPKLTDYAVETVPRYLLINKQFNVAEMNAPRASDPEVVTMINNLLK